MCLIARVARGRAVLAALIAVLAAGAAGLSGCGSSTSTSTSTSTSSNSSAGTSSAPAPAAVDELTAAERPAPAGFPRPGGRSLTQLARLARSSLQLGAATGTFVPGHQRFAFALTTSANQFVYAPTALYVAASPTAPAQGPFPAPADPMTVPAPFRSRQNAGPGGIQAIYAATVPVARPGVSYVLALTRTAHGMLGAPGEIAATATSAIPAVGQRPPDIATDTAATVHGDEALLTTRIPAEHMSSVSLRQVLGRRPVALLFSTPQLCISRVCGPVTDVAVALQHQFGNRITFIHEEVYVDNNPSRGLRPQLVAFHLHTEPWLFAMDRQGTIVARLEGSFGTHELAQALQAALR